jgi:RNA polymerase sigma-70 factor (ECF subfamily)
LSDTTRFEARVMPHLDAAYNLARWLTRDAHDAEDVVQDACVRAIRYADTLQHGDGRAWFLAIVRNAFYDWLGRNRPAELVYDDDAVAEAVDPAAANPEQSAQAMAELRSLADALTALPLQFREVLVLRELEDMSYREIARVAGIPVGTVMSRLARARALLQRSRSLQVIGTQRAGGAR